MRSIIVVNKPKNKGTRGESAFVNWLKEHGFPNAERRALSGSQDKGDVANAMATFEVKNCNKIELAKWIDEAVKECENGGGWPPVVIAKRKGKGDPAKWYAILEVEDLVDLLIIASTELNKLEKV